MKIVDAFTFYNELDLLELRLETLDSFVDYFVICEATTTHSGHEKPLILRENLDRFARFSSKMLVHTVRDLPTNDPWQAEQGQRNALRGVLKSSFNEGDIVIVGDADEIINPQSLDLAIESLENQPLAHFAQNLYYYYLNLQEVSGTLLSSSGDFPDEMPKKWLGSRMMRVDFAVDSNLNLVRGKDFLHSGTRVTNGGWHFSFVGSEGSASPEERIRQKLSAYAHQEKNTFRIRRSARRRVARNQDIMGRRGAKFEVVPIDDTFPSPVAKNPEKYRNLIAVIDQTPRSRLGLRRAK
jgi:beta-1,4-mannosyl-glycoprotein beta-1,4-N-acetylglucosaminyltransferase